MIFEEIEKRTGRKFIVGSKYWPDGTRFRRRFSNKTLAKSVIGRIEGAIAMGRWKELRKELAGDKEEVDYTIRQFAEVYFDEYCKVRNTRPDFKEERLKIIKNIVGDVKLLEFTSAHAAYFEKERAKGVNPRTGKPIAKATINRGLAVLSHMFTFALKKRLIASHPMTRYGRLRENEKALRVMTLEEERRLVQKVLDQNLIIGCYVGVLGETGLRKAEGLKLKWDYVDTKSRTIIVEAGKTGKTRYVPLSDYALELLGKLTRVEGCPFVFVWSETKQPVRDPRHSFFEGRKKAGLQWVGFHDLRHFRATQWIMRGVDIRSVQGLLGHRNIKTTERYVKFVPGHASQRVIEAQRLEDLEMVAFHRRQIGDTEEAKSVVSVTH
jgi:integrase